MLLIAGLPIAYVINRIAQAEERDSELARRHAGVGSRRAIAGSPVTLKEVLRLNAFWFLWWRWRCAIWSPKACRCTSSSSSSIAVGARRWRAVCSVFGADRRANAHGHGLAGDMADKRKLIMGLFLALSSCFLMGYCRAGGVYAVHDHLLAGLRRPGIAARADSRRLLRHKGICDDSRGQPDHHHRRNFHGALSPGFCTISRTAIRSRLGYFPSSVYCPCC